MAQLQITIDLDNAAFEEATGVEVARILAAIAKRFIEAREYGKWLNAYDVNGNPVGKFKVDAQATPSFS